GAGQAGGVGEFWAGVGVGVAAGDTHTSALALVDRFGFIRAAETGVPDVGGGLPAALDSQLNQEGRRLLAGHGDGWGAPQVLDRLRTLGAAGQTAAGSQATSFIIPTTDGGKVSLTAF